MKHHRRASNIVYVIIRYLPPSCHVIQPETEVFGLGDELEISGVNPLIAAFKATTLGFLYEEILITAQTRSSSITPKTWIPHRLHHVTSTYFTHGLFPSSQEISTDSCVSFSCSARQCRPVGEQIFD